MKSIHIRDLDESVIAGLKRRAKRHHRSLQKEVTVLLTDAARMIPPESPLETSPLERLNYVETGEAEFNWSRKDLYDDDGR